MSEESTRHPFSRSPITISEYINTQRAHGSCSGELIAATKRCAKAGAIMSVPFGAYVAYQYDGIPRTLRGIASFSGKIGYVSLISVVTFGGMGFLIGSYNCLRVVR